MHNYTDLEIMQSTDGYLEIGAKDGTKAEALTVLTDIYNVKPENVMALGDNYNDLYMLAWAGTGVAMGNADQTFEGFGGLCDGYQCKRRCGESDL